MRGVIKVVFTLLVVLLVLVGLEQMSYRFSSQYASARADWIWSQWDEQGPFSSVLAVLRFEQLASDPPDTLPGEASVREESVYAERILSHTRPMRDELYERFRSGEVLREFEVRDAGGIGDLALPGLQVSALADDVEKGWAKKVGEKMADARALLLRVLPGRSRMSEVDRSAVLKRTESQFAAMLEKGIACGFVHAADFEELILAVDELRRREGRLARRIFAWGRGKSAGVLAEAVNHRPELWSAVVYDSPGGHALPGPGAVGPGGPWVMGLLELNGNSPEKDSAQKMVKWARAGRNSGRSGPFASRLGGLFHFVEVSTEAQEMDGGSRAGLLADENAAMGYAFLLECAERLTEYEPEKAAPSPSGAVAVAPSPAPSLAREDESPVYDAVVTQDSLSGIVSPIPEPQGRESYDCQVLRDYRALHPELADKADKAVILMVGRGLESQGALQAMGRKDPEFLIYYQNLKVLSSNP